MPRLTIETAPKSTLRPARARGARRRQVPAALLLAGGVALVVAAGARGAAPHTHVSPDGLRTAPCTCRPADEVERKDRTLAPDGFVQDEPRASYNRGPVPLPTIPDWVGTRVRAIGTLVWGDADGDGDEDLFVGTYYAQQYPPLVDYYNFIYLNVGGMLERDPSWISIDQKHTTDASWGLIDGDGIPDLFVANGGQSLQPNEIFFGRVGLLPSAAGWFSSDNCWAIGCSLADFDLDGDVDVATANQGNSANPYRPTYIFRNLGTGLETVPSWASAQVGITNDADWGDVNGDGRPDLAVSGWVNWHTGVFLNLGNTLDTAFGWTTGRPERTDKGIGWALVDGDARPDLAVGGNGAPDWLFRNEGTTLGASPIWASGEPYHGCQDLAWIDIDRDGDEDLAIINFGNGHARIYLNESGVLSSIADWQYDAASSGTALAFGDVNGDGWPDLAIGVANGPVELFLNTGGTTTGAEIAGAAPAPRGLQVLFEPNPVRTGSRLVVTSERPFSLARIAVASATGRRVPIASLRAAPSRRHELVWPGADAVLGTGVYFVEVSGYDETGRNVHGSTRLVFLGR